MVRKKIFMTPYLLLWSAAFMILSAAATQDSSVLWGVNITNRPASFSHARVCSPIIIPATDRGAFSRSALDALCHRSPSPCHIQVHMNSTRCRTAPSGTLVIVLTSTYTKLLRYIPDLRSHYRINVVPEDNEFVIAQDSVTSTL